MIGMEKKTSAAYDAKYSFQRYFDAICDADNIGYAFDRNRTVQSILSDAMLDESIDVQGYVALVVRAYA